MCIDIARGKRADENKYADNDDKQLADLLCIPVYPRNNKKSDDDDDVDAGDGMHTKMQPDAENCDSTDKFENDMRHADLFFTIPASSAKHEITQYWYKVYRREGLFAVVTSAAPCKSRAQTATGKSPAHHTGKRTEQ